LEQLNNDKALRSKNDKDIGKIVIVF